MPRKRTRESDAHLAVPAKSALSLAETHRAMLAEAGISTHVLAKAGVRLSEALDATKHVVVSTVDAVPEYAAVPDWQIRLAAVKEIAQLLGAHAPQRLEHVGDRAQPAGPVVVVNVPDWLRPAQDVIEIKELHE